MVEKKILLMFVAFMCIVAGVFGRSEEVNAKKVKSIRICDKNFPDERVQQILYELYDTKKDWVLSPKEIKKIKHLDLSSLAYSEEDAEYYNKTLNLKGLDKLTNVESISVRDFEVKAKVLKSPLFTNAKSIGIWSDKIKKMDFSSCKKLESLGCGGSAVTSINITQNAKLKGLSVSAPKLTKLDISHNKKLKKISLGTMNLKENVEFNKCTKLKEISIRGFNSLNKIKLNKCKGLEMFFVEESDLKEVVINNAPDLNMIICRETPLEKMKIEHKKNIKVIQCSETKLTHKYLAGCTALEELELYKETNCIQLPLKDCVKLKELHVDCMPQIMEVDLSSLANLKIVSFVDSTIKSIDFSNNSKLKRINLSGGSVEELNLSGLCNFEAILVKESTYYTGSCLRENPIKKIILSNNVTQADLDYLKNEMGHSSLNVEFTMQ